MATIIITCNRCGGQATTTSVAETMAWDESHDAHCPALTGSEDNGS
jgi:hypothetical protein